MKINHQANYAEKRRAEYPPITDQLDALFKGGQAAADMKAAIESVKAKYPKPDLLPGINPDLLAGLKLPKFPL